MLNQSNIQKRTSIMFLIKRKIYPCQKSEKSDKGSKKTTISGSQLLDLRHSHLVWFRPLLVLVSATLTMALRVLCFFKNINRFYMCFDSVLPMEAR